jgi:hypothetical protein
VAFHYQNATTETVDALISDVVATSNQLPEGICAVEITVPSEPEQAATFHYFTRDNQFNGNQHDMSLRDATLIIHILKRYRPTASRQIRFGKSRRRSSYANLPSSHIVHVAPPAPSASLRLAARLKAAQATRLAADRLKAFFASIEAEARLLAMIEDADVAA